jgi:hypothetical protein
MGIIATAYFGTACFLPLATSKSESHVMLLTKSMEDCTRVGNITCAYFYPPSRFTSRIRQIYGVHKTGPAVIYIHVQRMDKILKNKNETNYGNGAIKHMSLASEIIDFPALFNDK